MKYLTIRQLNVFYNKKQILKNINLDLESNERIGIIGKNGAGKTTLIETIMGVNSSRITGYLNFENDIQRSIQPIFQDYKYDNDLNLTQIYKIYSGLVDIEPKKDIKALFAAYGLEDLEKKKFNKMSGGQQQKFKLLMCLELKPKLLILDEITTSLDFEWRNQIMKIISRYLDENQDTSLILVSHDYNELVNLTQKQYLIEDMLLSPVQNLKDYFDEYNKN